MKFTSVFRKNVKAFINPDIRIIVNQGGSGSSKTWSILQLLLLKALKAKGNLHTSIVSESLPHLKRGAYKDFKRILDDEGYTPDLNKTDFTFSFDKAKIELFGADDSTKLRGARRDILYINEANNISYDAFTELNIRTAQKVIIDFNPVSAFWAHEYLLKRNDVAFIKSTYKDNEHLPERALNELLARGEQDPEWAKVYLYGEVGSVEGLVFTNWTIEDKIPEDAVLIAHGLDFGFTNDPTACVSVYRYDQALWVHENLYEPNLTNPQIAQRLEFLKREEVIADSAEPKSIRELNDKRMNVKPAEKGADSIKNGIDILKRQPIRITKTSTNIIKEFRNYKWATDKMGETLNKPIDKYNHAIDAIRYVALNKIGKRPYKIYY